MESAVPVRRNPRPRSRPSRCRSSPASIGAQAVPRSRSLGWTGIALLIEASWQSWMHRRCKTSRVITVPHRVPVAFHGNWDTDVRGVDVPRLKAKYGAVSEIVGPVDRVVVVGAGIAGLAAASRLRRAGIGCVVLEARDRIGGRLHTIDLAGVPVDLGGSWIHHPIGNPIAALCDELGIVRDPGDPTPTLSAYRPGRAPTPRPCRGRDVLPVRIRSLLGRRRCAERSAGARRDGTRRRRVAYGRARVHGCRRAPGAPGVADGNRGRRRETAPTTIHSALDVVRGRVRWPGARRVAPRRLPVGGQGAGDAVSTSG